ncbi:hypothetical protein M0R04_03270 [Candidatus Dojkabacteria bacterium]|jgi:hypothetical protein|nr:hypothetical protein [Candidatus Dojkabacteria bacterium]
MQYVLAVLSTFLISFLEPLLANTLGISLFYLSFILLFQKHKTYLLIGTFLFISLLLDVTIKYPLGVYAFAFLASYFVSVLLSYFLTGKEIFQTILKYTIASFLFYLILKLFSVLPTFAFSAQMIGVIFFKSIFTGIIVGIVTSLLGGTVVGSSVGLKFKK